MFWLRNQKKIQRGSQPWLHRLLASGTVRRLREEQETTREQKNTLTHQRTKRINTLTHGFIPGSGVAHKEAHKCVWVWCGGECPTNYDWPKQQGARTLRKLRAEENDVETAPQAGIESSCWLYPLWVLCKSSSHWNAMRSQWSQAAIWEWETREWATDR